MPSIEMGGVSLNFDVSKIARLGNAIARIGPKLPQTLVGSLKHVGDKALTGMRRATAEQTGMKYKTIKKALTGSVAGGQAYVIKSAGGNVRYKYFRKPPREKKGGVTAYPRGGKVFLAGAFMKGGIFPRRVNAGLGGHVYARSGKSRLPITQLRSGVYIPDEMITGGSAAVFYSTVQSEYPKRIERDIYRLLGAL